jgi:5-methylcytosine-specific restriction endonuclease McrA
MQDRLAYNAYMRAYMATRYEERKAEAKAALGGKCVWCGSVDDLQFDHKDRSTKWDSITKIWGLAKTRVLEEVAKCQLLCRECHHMKTCADLGWKFRPQSERSPGVRARQRLRAASVNGSMAPL